MVSFIDSNDRVGILSGHTGKLILPRKRQAPDIWGAANRIYGAHTGVPGKRDPEYTPYMKAWERAMASTAYRRVVLVCGAQMGKTDGALDIIGERMDNFPTPILYVGPSKDFCTDQFEPRLMSLFDEAKTLSDKVARGRLMKKTRKLISGVSIRLAHAGSSTALKSDPAALAIIDEYDEMLKNIKGQGDPLGLVEARGFTYSDFVTGIASTPTMGNVDSYIDEETGLEFWDVADPEDVQSAIWKLWQQGTRQHFIWPCPHCELYFVPRFTCLKWTQSTKDHKTTPAEAAKTAYVACPRCGGVIEEEMKPSLNFRGRWISPGQTISRDGVVSGDLPKTSTASFWVSGLCSPFKSFGFRAEAFMEAVREHDHGKIQTAINSNFGECYSNTDGTVPEWEEVAEKAQPYKLGDLPEGVQHLVLTVDVQKNRLVYVIRGWSGRATSWLIDRGELWGETIETEVWDTLAEMMQQPIGDLHIKKVLIDSGFRPGKRDELPLNRVYEFCRRFSRIVSPTKGSSIPLRTPIVKSRLDVTAKGESAKYGLELLRLDTDFFKSWVHERIKWPDDQPGAWHLPSDIDEDYCRQIVSEARVRTASGKVSWIQRHRDNHYFDCEAMQAAASVLLNMQQIPRGHRPNSRPPGIQQLNATAPQMISPKRVQQKAPPQFEKSMITQDAATPKKGYFSKLAGYGKK